MNIFGVIFIIATICNAIRAELPIYSAKNVVNTGVLKQDKLPSGGNSLIENVLNTGVIKQKGSPDKKNNVIADIVNHDVINQ
ncbi:hypothetical protein FF38_13623 [Lucilia cuprina]|uniref:Uncharacterized protein n=1 Tax=Lucilia cuprina TaxID=7375 RepID=A0A0L0CA96_LUCCU|nr:hypothetical protein FF38_13623 [Lucilia cuprina]